MALSRLKHEFESRWERHYPFLVRFARALMKYTPALLPRRFAAAFYDMILIVAVWMMAQFALLPIIGRDVGLAVTTIQLYLAIIAFVFFGWFWTHGGQTLGMRVWRLKLVSGNGYPPGWYQSFVRYLGMLVPWLLIALGLELKASAAGPYATITELVLAPAAFFLALLGFLWPLFDKQKMAWHDRLSQSCLTVLPKRNKNESSTKSTHADQADDRE